MIVALVSESMDWSDMFRPPLVEFRVESLNRVCVFVQRCKNTADFSCLRLVECVWSVCAHAYGNVHGACVPIRVCVCVCERERERERNREIWSSVDEAGWSSNTPHAQQGKRSRLTVSRHRHCSSPPLSLLWLWRRMSGWSVSLSLCRSSARSLALFGEFADDSDERAVLVLQPLIVGSQIS